MIETVPFGPIICPWCSYKMDMTGGISPDMGEKKTPDDGDVTICMECTEWMVFHLDLPGKARKPTHEDYEAIVKDKTAGRLREALLQIKKRRADERKT